MLSSLKPVERIDYVNIGLLIFSCLMAFVIPFELFLFAYAVMGPLHYLTEISWLHDKNYYSTDRRDVILLVVVSLLLTTMAFKNYIPIIKELEFGDPQTQMTYQNRFIYVAFASSALFAFVKNNYIKLVGILTIILFWVVSDHLVLLFSVFIPTLIHVFIFTWLFMFYGALKNRSKPGYVSVAIHFIIPFILFFAFPSKHFLPVTEYGKQAYTGFMQLNYQMLELLGIQSNSAEEFQQNMFYSNAGVGIMRFIAFAYTYHYLNWFSKTKVIRWHDIPKSRSLLIVLLWVVSVTLYAIDYALGFKWLFLLSFMHVMVEFPLNYISFVGIFRELTGKGMKHSVN
jgi:hypothetical protein